MRISGVSPFKHTQKDFRDSNSSTVLGHRSNSFANPLSVPNGEAQQAAAELLNKDLLSGIEPKQSI